MNSGNDLKFNTTQTLIKVIFNELIVFIKKNNV